MNAIRLGEYEVLAELGRGGFGQVYRARGPRGDVVAVKVLTGTDRKAYARFAREQRLLESLGEAEGFVPLLASGVAAEGPFFVMPLLEGGTLRDRLAKGPLSCEETLELGRQLAAAIGCAHERGIVHRDLKPENILFTKDRRPLVADLGLAKHFEDTTGRSASLTVEGTLLGTPRYMAPEQLDSSKSVDARADVFSLGAVLYECLTGRAPFAGRTTPETLLRITKGQYERVQDVRKDTPDALAHPLGTALEQRPELRHADGRAFALALGATPPRKSGDQATPRPRRRSPVLFVGPVLLIGAAFLAGHGAPSKAGAPAPPAPAPTPRVNPVVERGWFDELLPPGLRRGAEKPVYVFDTKKGLELELVYVPPGDFLMGAINGAPHEKPIHTHAIPRGYYMGRTEVTWDQYRAFCRATARPEPPRPSWSVVGSHPVVNVSQSDVIDFCGWAGLALPTEAEWEKAARSTDTRQWPWGDEWQASLANTAEAALGRTVPVGEPPGDVSPYGVLGMAGNVAEWTIDWYVADIYVAYSNGEKEPRDGGGSRTGRGGSFKRTRFEATTTARAPSGKESVFDDLGLRVCLRASR